MSDSSAALPANVRPTAEPGVFLVDGHDDLDAARWVEAKSYFVGDPAALLARLQELALQARKPGVCLEFPRVQWQYPTAESLTAAVDRAAYHAVFPTSSQED